MSGFVDRMLLQLADPVALTNLISPAADAGHTRVLTLLNAVYQFPFAVVHDVLNVTAKATEFERPVLSYRRTEGALTQTIPTYTHTDLLFLSLDAGGPSWLDLIAELDLTAVLEIDPGQVDRIEVGSIPDFKTLDEFKANFQFLDVDAFMAEHDITTVDELKERFSYVKEMIRLKALAPFDAQDPANRHRYQVKIAMLIRDSLDVAGALRDAKLARMVLEKTITYRREVDSAEVLTPYAPLIVFPDTVLVPPALTAQTLQAFFGREGVLSVFVPPPA